MCFDECFYSRFGKTKKIFELSKINKTFQPIESLAFSQAKKNEYKTRNREKEGIRRKNNLR